MHEPGAMRQLERALDQAGPAARARAAARLHPRALGPLRAGRRRSSSGRLRALDAPEPRAHDARPRRTRTAPSSGASRWPARAACRPHALEPSTSRRARARGRHRRDRRCPTASSAGRGGRDRPRHLAGVRDARPRALARRAPPARARAAAVGRPPARAASRSTTTSATRPTRPASSSRASTWSTARRAAHPGRPRPAGPRRAGAGDGEPPRGARAQLERVRAAIARRAAHAVRDRARRWWARSCPRR